MVLLSTIVARVLADIERNRLSKQTTELEKAPTPEGAGAVIRDSREGEAITGHTAACPPARGDRPIGVATETAGSSRGLPPEKGICSCHVMPRASST